MIDEECFDCIRYYTGSCKGIEDRGREKITNENRCSGFLGEESNSSCIHNNVKQDWDFMK